MTELGNWRPVRFEENANGNATAGTQLGAYVGTVRERIHKPYIVTRAAVTSLTANAVLNVIIGSTTIGTITIPHGTAANKKVEYVAAANQPYNQVLEVGTALIFKVATKPTHSTGGATSCTFDCYVNLTTA